MGWTESGEHDPPESPVIVPGLANDGVRSDHVLAQLSRRSGIIKGLDVGHDGGDRSGVGGEDELFILKRGGANPRTVHVEPRSEDGPAGSRRGERGDIAITPTMSRRTWISHIRLGRLSREGETHPAGSKTKSIALRI